MARAYVLTARRRAALRKAQLASARKRRKGRMTPRQAKKAAKRSKYGSRRQGVTVTQARARQQRRNKRVATGIAYGTLAVYAGAAAYAIDPKGTTRAGKTAVRRVKAAPRDFSNTKHKAKMKYTTHRTNRQFKKIVKASY